MNECRLMHRTSRIVAVICTMLQAVAWAADISSNSVTARQPQSDESSLRARFQDRARKGASRKPAPYFYFLHGNSIVQPQALTATVPPPPPIHQGRIDPEALNAVKIKRLLELHVEGDKAEATRLKSRSELLRVVPPGAIAAGSYKLSTIGNTHSVKDIVNLLVKHHTSKSLAEKAAPRLLEILRHPASKRFLLITAGVAGAVAIYEAFTDEPAASLPTDTRLVILDYGGAARLSHPRPSGPAR